MNTNSTAIATADLPAGELSPPRVIANADVWLESDAVAQLTRVAALPACIRAVGMPDLHPGPGIPIGAAFAFAGAIRPALVGSDAGCGARLWTVGRLKSSRDVIERRLRAAFPQKPLTGVDPVALFEAVWQKGSHGLARVAGVPVSLAALAEREPAHSSIDAAEIPAFVDRAALGRSLGTIGGGNHFAEVTAVDAIYDRDAANELALMRRGGCILVHSGSRGLGRALAMHWGESVLTAGSSEAKHYLAQLAGALRFAQTNRLIIGWRLLDALGLARAGRLARQRSIDVTHNTVSCEPLANVPASSSAWIHRKGCAPAHHGQFTLILGSRGTHSFIARGLGNPDGLCSVAHGAGRRMTRSEARDKLRHRYRRRQLQQSRTGGRVLCNRSELLYEEHPDAYKDIEPVMASLEEAQLACRIAALKPIITVKQ